MQRLRTFRYAEAMKRLAILRTLTVAAAAIGIFWISSGLSAASAEASPPSPPIAACVPGQDCYQSVDGFDLAVEAGTNAAGAVDSVTPPVVFGAVGTVNATEDAAEAAASSVATLSDTGDVTVLPGSGKQIIAGTSTVVAAHDNSGAGTAEAAATAATQNATIYVFGQQRYSFTQVLSCGYHIGKFAAENYGVTKEIKAFGGARRFAKYILSAANFKDALSRAVAVVGDVSGISEVVHACVHT